MTLVFKYRKVPRPDPFPEENLPVIPVTLTGKKSIDVVALIDSGADMCALPMDIAAAFELDLSAKPEPVGGIGGETEAVITKMGVTISGKHQHHSFHIMAQAIKGYEGPVLLGRKDFFPLFEITFREAEEKIILKPVKAKV